MIRSTIRYGLLTAAVLVLAACASPASREAMTPKLTVATHHPFSLQVKTSGGAETGGGGSSNISDADLKAAIEAAVVESRLFKTVIQSAAGGDYELSVAIISLEKPMFGASFTVSMETSWSLIKLSDRSVVMRKSVKSSGVAAFDDAFAGVARLRIAVERAAKNSITSGLESIAELKL